MLHDAAFILLVILLVGASSVSRAEALTEDCRTKDCPLTVGFPAPVPEKETRFKPSTFSSARSKYRPCHNEKGVYSDVCAYSK